MRACVCSQNGIGDGLISLVLSENLRLAGWDVVTMHKCLGEFQRWIPNHSLEKYPDRVDFSAFDRFFVFYTNDNPFSLEAMGHVKTQVIYPYKGMETQGDLKLKWGQPFVKSLAAACSEMGLSGVADNGVAVVDGVQKKERQVLIHAVSSTDRKDWPIERFVEVARGLQARGYAPVFVLGDRAIRKKYTWLEDEFTLPDFASLDEITQAVAESSFFVGVCSGFGHLASAMGVPTVTIARQGSQVAFWRPGWAPGEVVTPGHWVPNLSGFRLRDRYWKRLVTVRGVLQAFDNLSGLQQR
jgi:heptosyltransferase III